MSSPLEFAAKMNRAATRIHDVPKEIVTRGALTLKKSVGAQLAMAAPRGRLNVGKKGQRIGVRYTVAATTARVFMFGPAHLIESDTKPHPIPRRLKSGKARRRGGKPVLIVIPGVGVRASAQHPGTKGKHPWAKGIALGVPKVGREASGVYFDALRKGLH